MNERIDHAGIAMEMLDECDHLTEMHATPPEDAERLLVWGAQVRATLALVEQQRIANLIALGRTGRVAPSPLFVDEPDPWDFNARGTLRPDIAAALDIEEVQS